MNICLQTSYTHFHNYPILVSKTKETGMDESEIRKQAISRYENGESPKQIYQSLGKSKKW